MSTVLLSCTNIRNTGTRSSQYARLVLSLEGHCDKSTHTLVAMSLSHPAMSLQVSLAWGCNQEAPIKILAKLNKSEFEIEAGVSRTVSPVHPILE